MTRTIDVTRGEREYLVGTVTEKNKKSLQTATFKVGLGANGDPPADWSDPDVVVIDGYTANVSLLVDSTDQLGTRQALWVRVIDNPEVYDLLCINDNVTVV